MGAGGGAGGGAGREGLATIWLEDRDGTSSGLETAEGTGAEVAESEPNAGDGMAGGGCWRGLGRGWSGRAMSPDGRSPVSELGRTEGRGRCFRYDKSCWRSSSVASEVPIVS